MENSYESGFAFVLEGATGHSFRTEGQRKAKTIVY